MSVFTRLIIMKMKVKMKNISHRYDINTARSRHGNKCSKYKKYLSMMLLTLFFRKNTFCKNSEAQIVKN